MVGCDEWGVMSGVFQWRALERLTALLRREPDSRPAVNRQVRVLHPKLTSTASQSSASSAAACRAQGPGSVHLQPFVTLPSARQLGLLLLDDHLVALEEVVERSHVRSAWGLCKLGFRLWGSHLSLAFSFAKLSWMMADSSAARSSPP